MCNGISPFTFSSTPQTFPRTEEGSSELSRREEQQIQEQVSAARKMNFIDKLIDKMDTGDALPSTISCALFTIPFLFMRALSYLIFPGGALVKMTRKWSCQLDINATIRMVGYRTFGKDFLAPVFKEALDTESEFDKSDGCGFRDSLWFLRSYFLTERGFDNHRDQMRALGRQFSYGPPPHHAALAELAPSTQLTLYDAAKLTFGATTEEVTKQFQNLASGAYLLHMPSHTMAYVCIEPGTGYFFDPNLGTVAIHNTYGYDQLARRILSYQRDPSGPSQERWSTADVKCLSEGELDSLFSS